MHTDLNMGPVDVPSPIDFHDPAQAEAWVETTVARRPWRPRAFEAYAAALNAHTEGPLRVAELGSGPGHLAAVLLERCRIAAYAAVDFSPAMHAIARAHLGEAAARVDFLQRDFRDAGWAAGLADLDAVVTHQAAHEVRHRARLPALFAGVFTALRPGGLFLIGDHYAEDGSWKHPDLYLARDEQPEALAAAGFTDVRRLLDVGGVALLQARKPL